MPVHWQHVNAIVIYGVFLLMSTVCGTWYRPMLLQAAPRIKGSTTEAPKAEAVCTEEACCICFDSPIIQPTRTPCNHWFCWYVRRSLCCLDYFGSQIILQDMLAAKQSFACLQHSDWHEICIAQLKAVLPHILSKQQCPHSKCFFDVTEVGTSLCLMCRECIASLLQDDASSSNCLGCPLCRTSVHQSALVKGVNDWAAAPEEDLFSMNLEEKGSTSKSKLTRLLQEVCIVSALVPVLLNSACLQTVIVVLLLRDTLRMSVMQT